MLRSLRKSDAEKIYEYVRDRDIVDNTLLPRQYKKQHAYDFIAHMTRVRRRHRPNDVVFVIAHQETKKFMGIVGIHKIDRTHNNAEIGYWLGKEFRGTGIVPEAVRLALGYCFRELKLMRIYAPVFATNEASQNVLIKCGFSKEGILRKSHFRRGRYNDSYLYSILRNELENTKRSLQ